MNARRVVLLATSTALAACTSLRGGNSVPHIDRIVPDSVLLAPGAVVEVVIHGRGFSAGTPGRNVVRFGDATIRDVPADDAGREIRLTIPQVMPSRGDAAPFPLEGGRYALSVETDAGVSNSVNVRVDR
jgi:hypothetical protein